MELQPSPERCTLDEYRYLRREMVLREAIQAGCLALNALFAGLGVASALVLQHEGPVTGFLLLASGLAGIWGHNDNLQVRMGVYLEGLEERLALGWERWLHSGESRLLGPIGSGHQVTTRVYFLTSELVALWAGSHSKPDGATWVVWIGLLALTVLVLIRARPAAAG